jgi:hypothetical protein
VKAPTEWVEISGDSANTKCRLVSSPRSHHPHPLPRSDREAICNLEITQHSRVLPSTSPLSCCCLRCPCPLSRAIRMLHRRPPSCPSACMPRLRLKGHLLHLPFARATGRKGPEICVERVESSKTGVQWVAKWFVAGLPARFEPGRDAAKLVSTTRWIFGWLGLSASALTIVSLMR